MKRYIARQVLIARLAALALCAVCLLQAAALGQGLTGYVLDFPSVGLAPGESLRLTLFNPNGAPVQVQAQLRHPGGMLVGMGDGSVRFVQAGISQTFVFKRSDIPLLGEESTGRLQLRASFYITLAAPGEIDRLAVSMETVSISDGTSNTIFVAEAIPSAQAGDGGNDVLTGGDARDILMGIIPGQTLRATLFNPRSSGPEAGSEAQRHAVSGHVKVFDGSGNLIAQSPDLVIPPGEFRSFDFNREALPSPGERGTGRLQMRASLEVSTVDPPSTDQGASRLIAASVELIDNSTGKTTAKCQNNLRQLVLASH
jgi:hypothetical protein